MIYQHGNTKIFYEQELDGDGRVHYEEFLRVIGKRIGRVGSIHEAFAGPGFIGFSLLEDGMCERLILSDIEERAIECCRRTIEENGLANRTSLYQSDCLAQIPTQEWDLVVGNPPHFSEPQGNLPQNELITVDRDWNIHRKFYRDVGEYLGSRGSVLLVENGRGSNPLVFLDMIEESGLRVAGVFKCRLNRPSKFYFIWVKKK